MDSLNIPCIFKKGIVLLISLNFPPEMSGGATGAWNRAMVLRNIGFKVFILAGIPHNPTCNVGDKRYSWKILYTETIGDFTVIRLRVPNLNNSGFFRPFILFVSFVFMTILFLPLIWRITSQVDIIYARSPIIFCAIPGYVYSRLMHSFYIYEVPDVWPDELIVIKSPLLPLVMRIGKIFAILSYRFPSIVITISESAAVYIKDHYAPRVNVFGIPSGVDTKKFSPHAVITARKRLISDKLISLNLLDKFIVLYSGRLSTAQKVIDLAFAAERLTRFKDIHILILGEGPQKNDLLKIINQKNLTNLTLLPLQERDMMPYFISAADVCSIFLSEETIFGIAIPTKFYEYLACQKPLIGICQGEVERIIRNNKIGFTCKSGDIDSLVDAILNLKSLLNTSSIRENCLSTLNEFSLESISLRFIEVLKQDYGIYNIQNSKNRSDLQ